MTPADLLASARRHLHEGQLERAIAGYEACLHHHLPVHEEYAGILYGNARFQEAAAIISRALDTTPDNPHLHFLRALSLLADGRSFAALADLDAALRISPSNLDYLRKRAAAQAQLDMLDAALEDFKRVVQLTPGDLDAVGNCGIIHLRRNEYPQAVNLLSHYLRFKPGNAQVLRSLANAHRGMGNSGMALQLLAELAGRNPTDNAIQTDYALTLLATGDFKRARECYQKVVDRSRRDQWALTGLYLADSALGDAAAAQGLMHRNLVIETDDADLVDRASLRTAVLSHQGLRWEPIGKSTAGGQQTTLLDLATPSFAQLSDLLQQRVAEAFRIHLDSALPEHPWHRGRPAGWKLQVWATVLHGEGGHQRSHIHPAGWLSGVYYLDSGDGADGEGQLVFGHAPDELRFDPPRHDFSHAPRTGQILLFPSFFLHHTTPYRGRSKRISIAFDVLPLD
ncbi:tetratricopeptide repeat protein [Stenotrophomonas sp. MYb238]|uniref:2OG-Fe(II) oxygenase family protein n=1 Tax=Stenotrophomonas sp. MYb238 TaxID=2040281 RepID=UPI0012918897|nr:putative 2OG-Fe(II) oxygenase [Stenotrophomonas sp. MYb238]MQP75664.1 tetratricopeptide repeat protein [Stenotrophomonas sp. MYb238]